MGYIVAVLLLYTYMDEYSAFVAFINLVVSPVPVTLTRSLARSPTDSLVLSFNHSCIPSLTRPPTGPVAHWPSHWGAPTHWDAHAASLAEWATQQVRVYT
eukprot:GHVU01031876.1.p2 GENE.GHVU01031876.1~~GHVU01031876.1.p2  ORF type:complete len:100 (+),score=2.40 GHVU01031876.1:449-748(+)